MKTFYHLLGNTILATVTNMTVWFALVFFVYLETRSVIATSIVSGIYLVVIAISGFWFGSLVDHYKKKSLMLLSGLVSLLIYAVAFVIYLAAAPETWKNPASLTLWLFVPLLLMGVIAGNIRGVALPTLITILIPEDKRDKANGLAGTATGIAFLIVSAISGFLVGHSGMYLVLILAMGMMIVTFFIGPIAQLIFIPFMTTGAGVDLIGNWFGAGSSRGIALVFTLTGIIGLCVTLMAMNTRYYGLLSERYMTEEDEILLEGKRLPETSI